MKRMLIISFVTISAIAVFFVLFMFINKLDILDSYYPDLRAAINDDMVGEGKWIPGYLPSSITDIHEIHDIDTNEIWITFVINASSASQVTGVCNKVNESNVYRPRKIPDKWWRSVFSNPQKHKSVDYYRCSDSCFIALSYNNDRGFFWDTASSHSRK